MIVLFQRHGPCVVIPQFGVNSHEKRVGASGSPSVQDRESDAALARRSYVAASAVASKLSAYHEQARREYVQTLDQLQQDAHADAQNVACTKCERCSEVLTVSGQQDNTRPPSNVFVAESKDSRQSDLRIGSTHQWCSRTTRTEQQAHVSKQRRTN